jgi:hypothetical protein
MAWGNVSGIDNGRRSMTGTDFEVRRAGAADAARWRELFDAYTRFYEREPDDAIAAFTW